MTGAGRGLGQALVHELRSRGWAVTGGVRRSPGEGEVLCDVSREDQCAAAAAAFSDLSVHLLVNCAALYVDPREPEEASRGPLDALSPEAVRALLDTNVLGPLRVLRAFHRTLAPGAVVVNVSSSAASNRDGARGYERTGYAVSKAALNRLTSSLAPELQARQVTVVALDPGWLATDMGGPAAPRSAPEGARDVVECVSRVRPAHAGAYLDLRLRELAW